jgi:hypothetical protein
MTPVHAQRIVIITDDGDQGLIALRACQTYITGTSLSDQKDKFTMK